MKKLLSLIAVSTLSTSVIPTSNLIFITKIWESWRVNNFGLTDNPFIKKVNSVPNNVVLGNVSVANNGDIYIGGEKGLYRSTDNGNNWTKVSDISVVYFIYSANNGDIYIGGEKGLYRSTDNGNNWTSITNMNVISTTVSSDGTIYIVANGCLYRSTDNGNNWTYVEHNLLKNLKKVFTNNTNNSGIIWAFGGDSEIESGLYRSTDNGNNWTKVSDSGGGGKNYIQVLTQAYNGNIYIKYRDNDVWKSDDNGNNWTKIVTPDGEYILSFLNSLEGDLYIVCMSHNGQYDGNNIYRSTDNGKTFNFLANTPDKGASINGAIDYNGNIYIASWNDEQGTDKFGNLYKLDYLRNNLLNINTPNYSQPHTNNFLYSNAQTIDVKKTFLKSATLDGNILTVPSTNIPITKGQHSLVLNLKTEYKQYAALFYGDINTGQIIYNFLIKTEVNPTNELGYKTTTNDTDLLTGLVSNAGNTNNCEIIQTKAKQGTGIHSATLNINLNSDLFNLDKSYYSLGTVDNNNNFTENGTKQKVTKNLTINNDGSYHLHLVDLVGNTYDSYLELGQNNWKLKGNFDDNQLNELSNKLNVTINLTDPTQKQQALSWLQNYKSDIEKYFEETVKNKGLGFNISIADFHDTYKSFIDKVTYVDSSTKEAINQTKLDTEISQLASEKLQDGLSHLPADLNVKTDNVVNRSTLDSYTSWIKNYQDFINKNKDQWINDIANVAGRGFATSQQIERIKNQIKINFNNYLKHVIWNPTTGLTTSNDYKQFVELDNLQADTIIWVNENIQEINQAYQNAIKNAESGLNLHGYSIDKILDGKQLPQTKSEIENIADGKSFHDWLQNKADSMYHVWQLKVGLASGLPLFGIIIMASLVCYWKFSAKHNPIRRADKRHRPDTNKKRKE